MNQTGPRQPTGPMQLIAAFGFAVANSCQPVPQLKKEEKPAPVIRTADALPPDAKPATPATAIIAQDDKNCRVTTDCFFSGESCITFDFKRKVFISEAPDPSTPSGVTTDVTPFHTLDAQQKAYVKTKAATLPETCLKGAGL
jgi:hypothetical protein